MKNLLRILTVFIAVTLTVHAQIPNSGFENWTKSNGHDSLAGWSAGNATYSTDHYPTSIGSYSIMLQNNLPLVDQYSYGYVTGSKQTGCLPSFPVSGHPTQLCGYYKCFPQEDDTIQIGIMLFYQGTWVAGGELLQIDSVSDWSSFTIPISTYTNADSATITLAAFYNDTTCQLPYGPYGNSVLYVDNISFDNLITGLPGISPDFTSFEIYPNPAQDRFTVRIDNRKNEVLKLTIYDALGAIVRTETLKQHQTEIPTYGLQNGLYSIEIKSSHTTKNARLILLR